jgi:DamX protein
MIERIYRETNGVPGLIINELSRFPHSKLGVKWKLGLVLVLAIAIACGVQWQVSKKALEPVAVEQKSEDASNLSKTPVLSELNESALSQIETPSAVEIREFNIPKVPVMDEPIATVLNELKEPAQSEVEVQEKPQQPTLDTLTPLIEQKVAPVTEIKAAVEVVSVARTEKTPEAKKMADRQAKKAERLWAKQEKLKQAELSKAANPQINTAERLWAKQEKLNQAELSTAINPKEASALSVKNFTLQLIVLSKQASVDNLLKKHPSISAGIRTNKTLANGQEKFVLEYGSYPDAMTANKARQSLPAEFHNAIARKIK